jgi:hypothetical protein
MFFQKTTALAILLEERENCDPPRRRWQPDRSAPEARRQRLPWVYAEPLRLTMPGGLLLLSESQGNVLTLMIDG